MKRRSLTIATTSTLLVRLLKIAAGCAVTDRIGGGVGFHDGGSGLRQGSR
jgi:hypothetical protein